MNGIITHEDVKGESCGLPSARLVIAGKSDDIASVFHVIVVLFEIRKDLTSALIQRQGAFLFWTFSFKSLAYSFGLGRTLDLGPKAWKAVS